jgi:hypothetical protein
MKLAWLSAAISLGLLAAGCVDSSAAEETANCSAPEVACGSVCSDLDIDPANCGACGNACEPDELCATGECVAECPGGEMACRGSCRDVMNETAHCGGCDRACAEGFVCAEGDCVEEGGGPPPADRRIRIVDERFNVCGRPIYMNGANTPWHRWNEFGGSMETGGVFDQTWWNDHYADLHEAGVNSSRVWITCSGEAGIDIDADGVVHGATDDHWADLDSFFAIAQENEIYVMATLMSFDHFDSGAQASWKAWIASDANIDSYVDNYLLPFLERYGQNPYLWSIDLINEPDWVYEQQRISWDRLRAYFARAARAIHDHGEVLVTVGMASPKYSAPCAGCEPAILDEQLREALDDPSVYLDFYSPHYYDWVGEVWGNTLHLRPDSANFPPGKPMTIGEHSARGTEGYTLTQDIEAAHSNGWQGTLPWTSNGVDRNGGFPEVSAASTAFRDAHPTLVFPSCP